MIHKQMSEQMAIAINGGKTVKKILLQGKTCVKQPLSQRLKIG